jgi:Protein of unknown function (DUF1254)
LKKGDIAEILSYDDRLGILTPNATTPYCIVFADLSGGPLTIDMPPNVRGGLSDAWQRGLPDTNKSAKYLVLGAGQEAPADVQYVRGYSHHRHRSEEGRRAGRAVPGLSVRPARQPSRREDRSRRRESAGPPCLRAEWSIGGVWTR